MTAFSTLYSNANQSSSFPEALKTLQNREREALEQLSIPTRKTEHWKYSARRLSALENLSVSGEPAAQKPIELGYDLDAYDVVIENGRICQKPASDEGIQLKSFAELSAVEIGTLSGGVIARAQDLEFATLNQASLTDGLFVLVDKQYEADRPLRILVRQSLPGQAHSRIYVSLGEMARLTLIEEIDVVDSQSEQTALLNHVTELNLAAGSALTYVRSDVDQSEAAHLISATGARLARDARLESHCLGFGKQLDRHDFRVELAEPGAECQLNGVCVTQDQQHYDNHTSIDHLAPQCQSDENYRCIADNQSQIVFNGRIHIHRDAQKTLGSMSNKNLLLSSGAEIDSKPELEIYADDVKCAHGTTIGQLDEREVYYLKTRGIQDEQARQMLTLGFVLEIVRANPVSELADYWESLLSRQLSFER